MKRQGFTFTLVWTICGIRFKPYTFSSSAELCNQLWFFIYYIVHRKFGQNHILINCLSDTYRVKYHVLRRVHDSSVLHYLQLQIFGVFHMTVTIDYVVSFLNILYESNVRWNCLSCHICVSWTCTRDDELGRSTFASIASIRTLSTWQARFLSLRSSSKHTQEYSHKRSRYWFHTKHWPCYRFSTGIHFQCHTNTAGT